MAKQWYVRLGGDVFGPLSSSQIERAAGIGHITPETPVSLDREHWYSASKVKGLVFPAMGAPLVDEKPLPPCTGPPPPAPLPDSQIRPEPPDSPLREPASAAYEPATGLYSKKSNKRATGVLAGTAILVMIVIGVSFIPAGPGGAPVVQCVVNPNRGLERQLSLCSSHDDIRVDVYYASAFSKDDVVFDFQDVNSGSVRRIDPVHLLLQFGHRMESAPMRRLILARGGERLFYLHADDVQELAHEYTFGNPMWAFNHLPERVITLQDTHAYGQWEGGWLGVLQRQTEDVNRFIRDWTGF